LTLRWYNEGYSRNAPCALN